MPAIHKKHVDPSHTIEHQRTVINDMAGDLQSLFVGTATINAAAIQVAGADIGAISDHDDKTIYYYYGRFNVDTTIGSPSKLGEIFSHLDATCDIDDGVTVTVDDRCLLAITDTTKYEFYTSVTEETNPQKLTAFADNVRTSIVKDMALDGNKKVGYFSIPDYLESKAYELHTPTDATFAPTTGDLILTLPNHNIVVGETINIQAGSIVFTCDMDTHSTNHKYPRATDPAYNKKLSVTAVTSTTVTVNVGITTAGNYPHKFVKADPHCVNSGGYTPDDLSIDIEDTFTLTVDDQAVVII